LSQHRVTSRRAHYRQARLTAALTGLTLLFAIGAQASLDSSCEMSPIFCDGVDDAVPVVTTCILPRDKMKDLLKHVAALVLGEGEAIRVVSVGSPLHIARLRPSTFQGRAPALRTHRPPAECRASEDSQTDPD
jgi:hypothetical protein